VIEAFGCALPDSFLAEMAARTLDRSGSISNI
jgi:hypothetical protein